MRTQIIIITFLVSISGCSIHNPFAPTTEQKIEKAEFTKSKIDAEVNQRTRQFVTGAKEILELKTKIGLNKEEEMSLDLVEQAERLLGGEPIEKIDINELSGLYDRCKKEYKREIREKAEKVTTIKKNELDNKTTITSLEHQLEEGKTKDSLWNRIRNAGISFIVLLIIGFILLLIFAPKVLGSIVAKIPSLISCLGVTSARVVNALVKGVQKARSQIAELPEGTKLDKKQILNMVDSALKEEADGETTNTVEVLRKKLNLPSISSKLRRSESGIGSAPSVAPDH